MVRGEAVAATSARMLGRSESRRSVKCEANWDGVLLMSSSVEVGAAVVSQRPGVCGEVGVGRVEVEARRGICRERENVGVRLMWAIRDVETLLKSVERAFARVD